VHHLIFDQNWVHPAEEDGTMNNIDYRSAENAFIINGDNITWTHNAIQVGRVRTSILFLVNIDSMPIPSSLSS